MSNPPPVPPRPGRPPPIPPRDDPKALQAAAMEAAFVALAEEQRDYVRNWLSGKQLKRKVASKIFDAKAGGDWAKGVAPVVMGGAAVARSHLPSPGGGSSGGSSASMGAKFIAGLRPDERVIGGARFIGGHARSAAGSALNGVRAGAPAQLIQASGQARQMAMEFVKHAIEKIAGATWVPIVMTEAPEFVTSFAGSIAPFVGPGVDVAKCGKAWGHAGAAVYRTVKAHRKETRLSLGGDAQAALQSLQTLLHRQIAKHTIAATQATATTALKTGLTFADLGAASGPLIGALSATADLLQTLTWMIMEMKEARAGNKILANPANIDVSVFEVCPLLGCYILTCSTRSNILNWLAEDIGSDHWMDEVQVMNKRITPILAIASHRIADARYELPVPPGVNAMQHAGDVIRADEGDLFIKLERIKQKAVGKAKAGVLHPQASWKSWRAGRKLKGKIKDQTGIAWDD